MEKLYELHNSTDFDLVVVDTPPSRNALDFLDAPKRLTRFLDHRLSSSLDTGVVRPWVFAHMFDFPTSCPARARYPRDPACAGSGTASWAGHV